MEKTNEKQDWLTENINKFAQTTIVISSILASVMWMNSGFNDVGRQIIQLERDINVGMAVLKKDIADVNKEVTIIKTVLIMQNILPAELAHKEERK